MPVLPPRIPPVAVFGMVLLAACTGSIGGPPQAADVPADGPPEAPPGTGDPSSPPRASNEAPAGQPPAGRIDVQRVPIRRLNNTEYDNTVRDLLGVSSAPARTFIADEKAGGFDTIAAALGMTDAQYEQYFDAAESLVDATFADAALRSRIVTCAPAAGDERTCTRAWITSFGRRAWRRPLTTDELDRLTGLALDARALGADWNTASAQVVKALLASVGFLYRIELDPDPAAAEPRRLNAFELASRISYLVWSSMPDEALFERAEDGLLLDDAALRSELDRMLRDPKSAALTSSFAGQWLGLRELRSHQVDAAAFPDWTEPLRESMIREGQRYFDEFLRNRRPFREFFSADLNFVDAPLAKLYGMSGSSFDPTRPTVDLRDTRTGFLGLAGFLTVTSFSYRTAPTLRGKWVLENLLCTEIPPPPANVPELEDDDEESGSAPINVRERLAEHRSNPTCAGCHNILDPIGLGLEHFDAIGRHRTEYGPGDRVDARGILPDGATFDGLPELAALLAKDPRLMECATEKLVTYALSRELGAADRPFLMQLRDRWLREDASLGSLLEQIVLSEHFRSRGGEAAP